MPTPLTFQKIQTANGIVDIPIYNLADFPNSPLRVMTSQGEGCFDLIPPTSATPIRVMTSGGVMGINTEVAVGGTGDATILVVKDTFTKANSSTSLGTTETGQVWQKYGSPVWGIQSNQAYPVTLAWDRPVYVETGISDNFDYQLTYAVRHTSQQVMWRIVDGTNYFCLQEGTIYRVQDDYFGYVMATIPNLANGDVVKIQVRGNDHTIKVNGIQRAQFADGFHLTGTKVGFSTNSTTSRIDDVTVHRL